MSATQTLDENVTLPVVKRGTVTHKLVETYGEIFNPDDGWLALYNIERRDEIELLGLSIIAGLDPLLLGDPGVGKTWLIELALRCIGDLPPNALFNTLVFKETPADDILGPRSLPAMKDGRIERMLDGYIGTAVLAYLDEIFKASPTLVNSLLDVMANRKLKVGRNVHDIGQLLCIIASSNELPDREDMAPFRDRFGLTKFVQPVRAPEGRKAVMRIQDEYQASARNIDMSDAPSLKLGDIQQIRAEVRAVELPDAVIETMDQAQERWAQAGFPPSMRRIGQMLLAVKARAWTRGEGAANTDDIIVTQHMAWNHPDHAKPAHDIVMEFANVFARKASRMREALEPILAALDDVKKKIQDAGGEPTDDMMEDAFKSMKQLRSMRKEAKEQIDQGKRQGHDVRDIEDVLSEVNRAHEWVERTMIGDDDD
jgi:MoxR-like ATPase